SAVRFPPFGVHKKTHQPIAPGLQKKMSSLFLKIHIKRRGTKYIQFSVFDLGGRYRYVFLHSMLCQSVNSLAQQMSQMQPVGIARLVFF
ncbi:MAG: hypothetical protein D5R98_04810, partial [Desulfonatronovibrio sp. MSAO_Bac4]